MKTWNGPTPLVMVCFRFFLSTTLRPHSPQMVMNEVEILRACVKKKKRCYTRRLMDLEPKCIEKFWFLSSKNSKKWKDSIFLFTNSNVITKFFLLGINLTYVDVIVLKWFWRTLRAQHTALSTKQREFTLYNSKSGARWLLFQHVQLANPTILRVNVCRLT